MHQKQSQHIRLLVNINNENTNVRVFSDDEVENLHKQDLKFKFNAALLKASLDLNSKRLGALTAFTQYDFFV